MLDQIFANNFIRMLMKPISVLVALVLSMLSSTFTDSTVMDSIIKANPTVPVYSEDTALLTLAQDGETSYKIVYGSNAARSEITAAAEFKEYFDRIAGTDIPLVSDAESAGDYEIIIGKTTRSADSLINRASLGDDGYRIAVDGNNLIIAGGELRGTLYGAYAFLEKFLGCRWFSVDVEVVPQLDTAAIPLDTDVVEIPAFAFRETSWSCSWNAEWRAKVGLNAVMHTPLDESYTDILNFAGHDVGHTFRFFIPEEVYFDSHPEYFALGSNGKRMGGQVCLSNEDVYQLSLAMILQWIQERPNAEYVSVSQNDNQNYCQCRDCAALDNAAGSHAGSLLTFVNRIARDVKAAGYEDIIIHTFAYQYTRKPPKNIVPEDNVMIMLCSIECNHADIYKNTDPDFYEDLKGWAAICDRLFIWDYNTNFSHYLTPFPDLPIMQTNIQMFYENSAEGFFMQGNSSNGNGEFGELRAYMIAKLIWDPYCDIERHMDEFMYYYYGPGYLNIKEYLNILDKNKSEKFGIFKAPEDIVCLNYFDLARIDLLWDACEEAAADSAQLARIQKSRLQVQYYKSVTRKAEFMITNDYDERVEAGKALFDSINSFGIRQISERYVIQSEPNFWDKASTWNAN